jgi:hypothetical protein
MMSIAFCFTGAVGVCTRLVFTGSLGHHAPMVDSLSLLSGKISTHVDGKAYDRIFVPDPMAKGLNKLKLESVTIQKHRHGKGEERRVYTDHFPVVAAVKVE